VAQQSVVQVVQCTRDPTVTKSGIYYLLLECNKINLTKPCLDLYVQVDIQNTYSIALLLYAEAEV